MIFGEKLKAERARQGWTQEELAEKLFVSRQSVSKWENGQNYPSIEIIIKISDLFGVTIDELLRSDQQLTNQVIQEGRQLAFPRIKFIFDVFVTVGIVLLAVKIGIILLNKFTSLDIKLLGGRFMWNFGPLMLMVFGGIGSNMLKDKYKKD